MWSCPVDLKWSRPRRLKVLDFDTECRPLHYSEYRDESQLTAYAWSWVGPDKTRITARILEQDLSNEKKILKEFLKAYHEADIVTGHYITRHDLPLLTDHCMRFGLPLPEARWAQDTKTLLPTVRGLGLSQENLSTLYELDEKKHRMNGRRWAGANTLTPAGRREARLRVMRDVRQHKALLKKLTEKDYLDAPRRWSP
jgi:DNA polymerase elongation subunit (family B)